MECLSNLSPLWGLLPLSSDFVLANVEVCWCEIEWAYARGVLGWRSVVGIAKARLRGVDTDKIELLELAYLQKADSDRVVSLVRNLSTQCDSLDESLAEAKWAFAILKCLHDRRSEFRDPLGLVEIIYGEFDYPDNMSGFVRWMPSPDGMVNPTEGGARIRWAWETYLDDARARFCAKRA
jgi:hypothetical protein